ncbi:unnamed protein product [Brugia pahangi]|uniref:CPSF_A domain-containing protein n=1 Tax=Brugia pahangi TaxID=6280 RepID=A0A0N4TBJ8_BRUPA|nr:unnamed protein product [Brugia pahangi]
MSANDEQSNKVITNDNTDNDNNDKATTTTATAAAIDQSIDMQFGTYVAVGIIFRERDDGNLELLLTQEAKRRCLGKFVINYFISYIEIVFAYV